MKPKLSYIILFLFLAIPSALLVGAGVESKTATLNLSTDFSSTNNRCIVGFTRANAFGRYDSVKEESRLILEHITTGSDNYTGSINMFYQMDNLSNISVKLRVKTPFLLTDSTTVIPATLSVSSHTNGSDSSSTSSMDITSGAERIVYQKPATMMWEHGYLPIVINVPGQFVLDHYHDMNISTIAVLELIVTSN